MAEPRTLLEENRQLRLKVERLAADLRHARAVPHPEVQALVRHFGLTRTEALILYHLSRGDSIPATALAARCGVQGDQIPAIRAHMSKIRSKLGDIAINATWGVGYCISKDACARLRQIMSAGDA